MRRILHDAAHRPPGWRPRAAQGFLKIGAPAQDHRTEASLDLLESFQIIFPADEIGTAETVDLITLALYAVTGTTRRIHDAVDEEDPTSADILHTVLERLEQLAWMIDAENRIANRSIPRPIHE